MTVDSFFILSARVDWKDLKFATQLFFQIEPYKREREEVREEEITSAVCVFNCVCVRVCVCHVMAFV